MPFAPLVRTLAVAAVAVALAAPQVSEQRPATVKAAVASSSTPLLDTTTTATLRASADQVRRDAGLETLYTRSAYTTNAVRIATAAMNGTAVAPPGDDAPMTYTAGTATDLDYDWSVGSDIDAVVEAARTVLRYPLHTDGGWAVMTKRLPDGSIRYGVALVVGWPNPTMPSTRGCSSSGYCWSNGGLNPHLTWTRNTVKWYLSTANLPSAGESLVKAAIAKVNAVSQMGAHVVYGGKTAATGPTSTRRFVIVFGSGCSTSNALGCTITSTQGTYRMVFQAKTIVTLSRYRANPSTTWWVGTLMHEIAHGMGLGHYDSSYNGTYQLMRSANGPDYIKTGDANGLRRIAPGGRVSATLTPRRSSLRTFALAVKTANAGLGGIRAIRTQCTDSAGRWQTVGLVAGTWDGRTAERVVGSFTPPAGASRSCRAIVRSKTGVYTTPNVAVHG
jgi:hypothetical protein